MRKLTCFVMGMFCAIALPVGAQFVVVTPPPFKALEDLDRCLRDRLYIPNLCNDRLGELVKERPTLAFGAAKLARLRLNSANALPYFEIAARGKEVEKVCADDDFETAAFAGLSLPTHYTLQGTASRLFGQCYAQLAGKVKDKLTANASNSYFKTNACIVLTARKDAAVCAPAASAPEPVAAKPPSPLPTLDRASTQLERVKTYRGPEGELVSIAFVKDQPELAVIYFNNIRGAWNTRAWVHRFTDLDNNSGNYSTEHQGGLWTSVVLRQGYYKIYAPGQQPFDASYSEKDTVSAATLLKALP